MGGRRRDELGEHDALHHRLLHEGGFRLRKHDDGVLHFTRPDGREIPRGGYRVEDMVDEPAVAAYANNPSMEGFESIEGLEDTEHFAHPSMEGFADTKHFADPSMEVREPRAVYRIAS